MVNKIVFHSKKKENIGNLHSPEPSKNNVPQWFSSADKYKKQKNGLYELLFTNKDGNPVVQKAPSWKSCPAILDTMISGYILKTPVEIKIGKVNNEYCILNEKESGYFCGIRGLQDGFPTPDGYESLQFNWITNWMPQVPKGYTTLWVHPLNRFDLPFISVSGFIDTESYTQKGRLPFFIKKDFEGVIPAGTPFIQIIPVKNESWEIEIKSYSEEEIRNNNKEDSVIYATEFSNRSNYKNRFWVKKQYD